MFEASNGKVRFADQTRDGGLTVAVQHARGYLSRCKRTSRLLRRPGARVAARPALTLSGNAGEVGPGRPAGGTTVLLPDGPALPLPDPMNRPDDLTPDDETEDPFADVPDAWTESDRAWDTRWSDDAEEVDADTVVPAISDPVTPSPRPTTTSVADSYLDGMQGAGPYLGLGMQIAASMALFVGGGYAVDRWLGTAPVGLLVGAVLGMVGIVALVVRIAREADAQNAARKAKK